MSAPLEIPERLSSLKQRLTRMLPSSSRAELENGLKRKSSALKEATIMTSGADLLEAKLQDLEGEKEHLETLLEFNRGNAVLSDVEIAEFERQIEQYVVLIAEASREQHVLAQDIEEHRVIKENVARDWKDMLLRNVFAAKAYTPRKKKSEKFDQARFSKGVANYLASTNKDGAKWCHILGMWRDGKMIKCAHITPKSLNSATTSRLFGTEVDVDYDPRNGK